MMTQSLAAEMIRLEAMNKALLKSAIASPRSPAFPISRILAASRSRECHNLTLLAPDI